MREFVLGDRGGESPLSIAENRNQNKQEKQRNKEKKMLVKTIGPHHSLSVYTR